jgi:hypothetical protein
MKGVNIMKKNIKMYKALAILLLIVMVALILVSGTYAKYTTAYSGSDTATVAKWDVSATGFDTKDTTTIDLFDASKIYDLDGLSETELADLSTAIEKVDEDVAAKKIVAPGTWGKVSFELTNSSDVSAKYAITIDSLETTLPLKFSVDGATWKTAKEIADVDSFEFNGGTIKVGSTDATTATLYWKWDYEGADTDVNETALGEAGEATCVITAGVLFTQVD